VNPVRLPTYESRTTLTQREKEIWSLLAEGHSNKVIAQTTCVAEQTVKFHLTRLYVKLGVTNRTEAAAQWWQARAASWQCCGNSIYTPFCPWCGAKMSVVGAVS